jgi:hypothetical protein
MGLKIASEKVTSLEWTPSFPRVSINFMVTFPQVKKVGNYNQGSLTLGLEGVFRVTRTVMLNLIQHLLF